MPRRHNHDHCTEAHQSAKEIDPHRNPACAKLEQIVRPVVQIDPVLVLEHCHVHNVVGFEGAQPREALGEIGVQVRTHVRVQTLDLAAGGAIVDGEGVVHAQDGYDRQGQPGEDDNDQD